MAEYLIVLRMHRKIRNLQIVELLLVNSNSDTETKTNEFTVNCRVAMISLAVLLSVVGIPAKKWWSKL